MAKNLGLDLGTNSIGWAIRESEKDYRKQYYELFQQEKYEKIEEDSSILDNEIVDDGVLIFKKGVGQKEGKEVSLAAERRKNRSKRRLYNAKRYRKWELLKVLIEDNMCPLTLDELRLWSIGNWQEIDGKWKNKGRIYPINNVEFQQWLAFDPSFFGSKETSENGKPIRKNPYDLRCELIKNEENNEYLKKFKIGRALYHLVQRRGFKSSRKSGNSTYAENKEIEARKQENQNFQISVLAKEKLDKGERFRASGVIQRRYFEDEFEKICEIQKLSKELTVKLHKAIYFVRPLRTQKGLVGNCTLEKSKPRIPISHPKFEEFRALQFINNIKWREKDQKEFVAIPMDLKKKILEELFFKKNNKGRVNKDCDFKFDEIIKNYSRNGEYEFNYKNLPNVSTCPTIAKLMNVFDEEWTDKFIQDKNIYGINWDSLSINYKVKYGNKKDKDVTLKVDEIWHLLFDYIQTKDKQEELENFCVAVLDFNETKAKEFSNIDIPQGYGSLSYKAISKILPFLQNGFIYSEAVLFANLKKVFGEKFEKNKEQAKNLIAKTIIEVGQTKEQLNIVNGLIKKFFGENEYPKPIGIDNETVIEAYYKEVKAYLPYYFGSNDWNKKSDNEKTNWENTVWKLYQKFLNGEQTKEEKSTEKATIDFYKLPRLDEAIKQSLKDTFNVSDNVLKYLYHPSDIEMYPVSRTGICESCGKLVSDNKQIKKEDKCTCEKNNQIIGINLLESPQPPSKGWKNQMAMRTLHELRHLLNYLLKIGKIDKNTKVVVEMARELNDANKRWAIQTHQRYREEENIEFAKAIVGVVKEKYPNLNENDIENVNKVRLWWEQVDNNEEIYKQIKALKEDIEKYRLWKEQECVCMYTGKMINITNLFDGTQTEIDHTLPRSKSFDNSLSNRTVCDKIYNGFKGNRYVPSQLPNYSQNAIINGKTYTAIEPRLKKWRAKVEHLKNLIDENKKRTKKTQDPETKKGLIQRRHLLQFDYDYWNKKLETFTLTEIPAKWKNNQLVDTQIISKYARSYLKTVFEKVDVQKGSITDIFKKIYQIKGNEQKDRSKHSHHAVDAAILTLITSSTKREAILEEYFKAEENHRKFHAKPYEDYKTLHLLEIEENIGITHIGNDKTITNTKKKVRKRGDVVFLKDKNTKQHILDENGKTVPMILQGDTIRGQINEESFLGAINPPLYENNRAIKENGKWKTRKEQNGNPEIWIVKRLPIGSVNFEKDIIIDEKLKEYLKQQILEGKAMSELRDFQDNKIRHIRCRVKTGKGFQTREKTIELKRHSYQSDKDYKQNVLSKIADNYLCLLYQKETNNDEGIVKNQRQVRVLSLFHFNDLGFKSLKDIWKSNDWNICKIGDVEIPLFKIIKQGTKVLLMENNKEELKQLSIIQIKKRLFVVYKFNESFDKRRDKFYYSIFLKNNLDARPTSDIDKECEDKFNPEKYQAGLCLKPEDINCLFEGIDFEIKPDGTIKWIE